MTVSIWFSSKLHSCIDFNYFNSLQDFIITSISSSILNVYYRKKSYRFNTHRYSSQIFGNGVVKPKLTIPAAVYGKIGSLTEELEKTALERLRQVRRGTTRAAHIKINNNNQYCCKFVVCWGKGLIAFENYSLFLKIHMFAPFMPFSCKTIKVTWGPTLPLILITFFAKVSPIQF